MVSVLLQVPGHQEIELALVKLYHETGLDKYKELSYFFLEERGHGHGVGYSWSREGWGAEYKKLKTLEGGSLVMNMQSIGLKSFIEEKRSYITLYVKTSVMLKP
jgi:hypothetical protein